MEMEYLEKLNNLAEKGILTPEEFKKEKEKILLLKTEYKFLNKFSVNEKYENLKNLEKLNELKDKNIITDDEFNLKRTAILKSISKGNFINNLLIFIVKVFTVKDVLKCYLNSYRNRSNYDGNASRFEFFSFYLVNVFMIFIYFLLIYNSSNIDEDMEMFIFFTMLCIFAIPSISIHIRRWHDIGVSGWFFLINISLCIAFVFTAVNGLYNLTYFVILLTCLLTIFMFFAKKE